jgi:hypothetical protein
MNRRNFLHKSALTAAGFGMAPLFGSSFQSVYGQTAPSNKVKVALIGCRSMGWSDLNTFLQYPEVECVALCDVDDEWLNKRAADVLKIQAKRFLLFIKTGGRLLIIKMLMWLLSAHQTTGIAYRWFMPVRPERMCM